MLVKSCVSLKDIDVLMAWHAFMLNPRDYLEDCVRFGLKDLWATGMPWSVVNDAIDTNFNYNIPQEGMDFFASMTGLNWNNADDPMSKAIQCPQCRQTLNIPWTEFMGFATLGRNNE